MPIMKGDMPDRRVLTAAEIRPGMVVRPANSQLRTRWEVVKRVKHTTTFDTDASGVRTIEVYTSVAEHSLNPEHRMHVRDTPHRSLINQLVARNEDYLCLDAAAALLRASAAMESERWNAIRNEQRAEEEREMSLAYSELLGAEAKAIEAKMGRVAS